MSSNSPAESPARPSPRRWRRPLAICLFTAACLATLVVAFFVVERVRGQAAWRAYEAEAKARGVKMMLAEYVPPAIPDAENFAATPLFDAVFAAQTAGTPIPNPFTLPRGENAKQPAFGDLQKQQRIDLAAWQQHFIATGLLPAAGESAAADVLTALGKYDAPLAELREAGKRPATRFPVKWEDGIAAVMPHLTIFQGAAKVIALRMAAHLALGQRAEALADFREGLRLYTALRDEPSLISGLVRVSVLSVLESAVWGGLAGRQWGDEELRVIETELARLRLLADYQFAMGSERGFSNQIYSTLHGQSSRELATLFAMWGAAESGSSPSLAGFSLYPRGWFYRSQVRTNLYIDEMLARVTADPPRLDPTRAVPSAPKPPSTYDRIRHLLFHLSAPALEKIEVRYALSQTVTDQTRLACALERYRLARGAYPATLDALAPEFLPSVPRDVMTGEPLRYRLEEGGQRFTLYSVAFNGADDGGETGGKSSATDQLDWVWRYPAK